MKLKWQARNRVRLLCSHPAWGPDTSQEIIHNWHWRSGKKTFIDKVEERQALFIKISYHSWVWEAAALTLSAHQQYVSLREHLSLFWMRLVRVMPAAELRSLMDRGFWWSLRLRERIWEAPLFLSIMQMVVQYGRWSLASSAVLVRYNILKRFQARCVKRSA